MQWKVQARDEAFSKFFAFLSMLIALPDALLNDEVTADDPHVVYVTHNKIKKAMLAMLARERIPTGIEHENDEENDTGNDTSKSQGKKGKQGEGETDKDPTLSRSLKQLARTTRWGTGEDAWEAGAGAQWWINLDPKEEMRGRVADRIKPCIVHTAVGHTDGSTSFAASVSSPFTDALKQANVGFSRSEGPMTIITTTDLSTATRAGIFIGRL